MSDKVSKDGNGDPKDANERHEQAPVEHKPFLTPQELVASLKARGVKFTFGTNNQNANIGRLEWALEAVKACGITKDDMWFPTDSVRLSRQTTIYNTIIE